MEENNQGEENENKSNDDNEEKKDNNSTNNINDENQDKDLTKDNNINEENQVDTPKNINDENKNENGNGNEEENNLNKENEINNEDNNKENNDINNSKNVNLEKEKKDNSEEIKQNENENKNENANINDSPIEFVRQNEELKSIKQFDELIKNCNNYKKIIVSNNKLSKISEFFIFKNVSYLDLSNNYFQKLEIIYNLENLQTLLLNNNSIQHLNMSLKYLINLTHLDLSNNRLDMNDGISIKVLKYNINLRELLLKGNVNYEFGKVKIICLESIKNLIYLDGERIFGSTRRNRSLQKSFVDVKGKRGNSKRICRLREYIEFKINDIKNNQNEVEVEDEINKKDDIVKRFGLDKRSKEKNTSNYYFTYLSSM